jgi:hypothetical protein
MSPTSPIPSTGAIPALVPPSTEALPANNAADAQRFVELISPQRSSHSAGASEFGNTEVPADASNLGDAILKSLRGLRNGQQADLKDINQILSSPQPASKALELQYHLLESSLRVGIVAKAVGFVDQDIQTLFRGQ